MNILNVTVAQSGPNEEPLYGVLVVVLAAASCLLIGNITALAPIVTTPFLVTYAAVDYAYFALAVTADIRLAKDYRNRCVRAREVGIYVCWLEKVRM